MTADSTSPVPNSDSTRNRWRWFWVWTGLNTVVMLLLATLARFPAARLAVFGWLPLELLGLFAVFFAGEPSQRRRWPAFLTIAGAGLLVSIWFVFFEGLPLWAVAAFGTVPFVVVMFLVAVMNRRRVAPHRVVQILATILLNAYILAYLQQKILYAGLFKYIPQPILNCYGGPLAVFACPIGSFQQIIGIHRVPWLVMGFFIVIGALVGRAACGWLCPFGLWQDLLYKIRVGPKAGATRWVALGAIALIGAIAAGLLIAFLHVVWWRMFLYAWLPFTLMVLYVVIRGKLDIPKRMWLGGFLAAVGLAAFVFFKFEQGYGVVAAVVGMLLLGLTGRGLAALLAAQAAFLLGALGPSFAVGPFSGAVLGLVMAAAAAGVVLLFDSVLKVSLPATFLKSAFLGLVAMVIPYVTAEPWFCKLCPQGTFGAGLPLVLWDPVNGLRALVGWLYVTKIGVLLAVVAAAIAIKRPFCRLVCPIGAVYSVFNKASLLRLKLNAATCTGCSICKKVCPMNIEPHQSPNQLECIRCFECAWNCTKGSLKPGV